MGVIRMSSLIILLVLFVAGAFLLTVEIISPGFGIPGITGAVLLIVSVVFTLASAPYGIYIVAAEIVFIAVFGVFLWRFIKKRQLYGKLVLTESLSHEQPTDLRFYIGKEGIAKTPLKPIGGADFSGSLTEVYSESGFLSEGVRVKVSDVRDNKIYVKELREN
jgi:membrane-bound serine protease (ClpP class)